MPILEAIFLRSLFQGIIKEHHLYDANINLQTFEKFKRFCCNKYVQILKRWQACIKIEEYGNWNLDEVNISLAVMSQRIVRSDDLENISYAHHQLRFLVGLMRREGLALHQKMELQKGCRPIYDCTPHKTVFSRSFFYF